VILKNEFRQFTFCCEKIVSRGEFKRSKAPVPRAHAPLQRVFAVTPTPRSQGHHAMENPDNEVTLTLSSLPCSYQYFSLSHQ
jgi:hypothetical protein